MAASACDRETPRRKIPQNPSECRNSSPEAPKPSVNEDKATRYQRLKRFASIAAVAWAVIFLGGLLATGFTTSLRDTAVSISSRLVPAAWQAGVTVLVYVVLLTLLNEVGSLPLSYYSGMVLERRYELSTQTLRSWMADQAKSLAVGLVLTSGAVSLIYWCIRLSPDRWWLIAGAAFAVVIVVLTNLAPVVLLPLFYSIKPPNREALRARLVALADRAGARVLGAYEWGLSDKTKKANAALAGVGGTRRILVSDTMLAEYSDDEIEVVLAHELAHHVHGDIWKGILFESLLILAGFSVASLVLRAGAGWIGLRGIDDVAGLPLLVLTAGAVSLLMMPLADAVSAAFERSAHRFALDLTRQPLAGVS